MSFTDLESLELFAGCSKKDLRVIRSISTPVRVDAGRLLTEAGTYGREAMLIERGTATVTIDNYTVAEVGAGDLIGEMALLDGPTGERNATVTATTDCEILVFTPSEFRRLMTELPIVAERIMAIAEARALQTSALV